MTELLEALIAAMRLRHPERLPFPNEHFLFTVAFDTVFEVRRAERKLTFWQIDELGLDRFVGVHPLLRYEAIRQQILDVLSCLAGVTQCSALGVGGLEIFCQPHRVNQGNPSRRSRAGDSGCGFARRTGETAPIDPINRGDHQFGVGADR